MRTTQIMVRILGGVCMGMFASLLSAQQTFQSYSLLDEGGNLRSDQMETLELLSDKNDSTVYSVPFTGKIASFGQAGYRSEKLPGRRF